MFAIEKSAMEMLSSLGFLLPSVTVSRALSSEEIIFSSSDEMSDVVSDEKQNLEFSMVYLGKWRWNAKFVEKPLCDGLAARCKWMSVNVDLLLSALTSAVEGEVANMTKQLECG